MNVEKGYMRYGDLVKIRHVVGHKNECLRIWDIPKDIMPNIGEAQRKGLKWSDVKHQVRFREVIDKIWAGEIGVVLEIQDDFAQILTPRGVAGWLYSDGLEVVSENLTSDVLG